MVKITEQQALPKATVTGTNIPRGQYFFGVIDGTRDLFLRGYSDLTCLLNVGHSYGTTDKTVYQYQPVSVEIVTTPE